MYVCVFVDSGDTIKMYVCVFVAYRVKMYVCVCVCICVMSGVFE